MKKTILFSILALLGMTQAVAQDYEYVPFVREGVKWVYIYVENLKYMATNDNRNLSQNIDEEPDYRVAYLTLEIKGDTIINGKNYKAMHKYHGSAIDIENDTIPIYLREDEKIVYGIIPEGRAYGDCFVYNSYNYQDWYDGNEHVLYDFNDPITWWESINSGTFDCLNTEMIDLGSKKAKCYVCTIDDHKFYQIEGIGFDAPNSYTLALFNRSFDIFSLSHVVENGEIIYKSIYFDPSVHVGIDEAVADKPHRAMDGNYYNLMGQSVGKEVPTTPGIYIHNGKKICVSRMP